jgi:hypothetical protein
MLLLSLDQEATDLSQQLINKVDLWRIFMDTKRETELKVRYVIDVMHQDWIPKAFEQWYKYNPIFTILAKFF